MPVKAQLEIFLAKGARIPAAICASRTATIAVRKPEGRRVRAIVLRGGEAEFMPGGSVSVRERWMRPGHYWYFRPLSVLKICRNGTEVPNWYLCPVCKQNTGELLRTEHLHGRAIMRHVFVCRDCRHEWQHDG